MYCNVVNPVKIVFRYAKTQAVELSREEVEAFLGISYCIPICVVPVHLCMEIVSLLY